MKPDRQDIEEGDGRSRMPRWLRIVLMTLLVLAVAAAFYLNNLKIIDYLENR